MKLARTSGLGAIHKRRRNILGGKGGLKFRCCKILEGRSQVNQGQNSDMGEGGIKNGQKNSDVFYERTLSQNDGEDFVNFCGLLRKHELYKSEIYFFEIIFLWATPQVLNPECKSRETLRQVLLYLFCGGTQYVSELSDSSFILFRLSSPLCMSEVL